MVIALYTKFWQTNPLINFNDIKKDSKDETFNENEFDSFFRLHFNLNNKIRSGKLFIMELLSQIAIMFKFNFFSYKWFLDFRLRLYLYCSALNPTLPLGRNFLQFFDRPATKINYFEIHSELLQSLQGLKNKNLTCCDLFEKTPLTLKNLLLSDCFKQNEAFSYYTTLIDIKNCYIEDYQFCSMPSLDSSNSGIQMLGLNLRSKNISKMATY